MKVIARAASKDMRMPHTIIDEGMPKPKKISDDGVTFEVSRSKKVQLSGYYKVEVSFTLAEITALYQAATTARLEERIKGLEGELSKLKAKLAAQAAA